MNEIKCIKIREIYITSKIFYLLVYIFAAWESDAQNHLLMPLLKMLRDSVVGKSFGRSFFELFPNQRIIFGCSSFFKTNEMTNERTNKRTGKQASEQTDGRTIKRTSERTADERASERADERANERTSERANERTSERANERTSERANERTSERANERTSERVNKNKRTNERDRHMRSARSFPLFGTFQLFSLAILYLNVLTDNNFVLSSLLRQTCFITNSGFTLFLLGVYYALPTSCKYMQSSY